MGNRLYVGNLAFQTTSEELQNAFSAQGVVTEATVVTDRDTGHSRGFGFVTMSSEGEAKAAMDRLNGTMLDGRTLRVNEAEDRNQRSGGGRASGRGAGRPRY